MTPAKVFLVEDETVIRLMVADMLEELGYRIAAEAGEINEAWLWRRIPTSTSLFSTSISVAM